MNISKLEDSIRNFKHFYHDQYDFYLHTVEWNYRIIMNFGSTFSGKAMVNLNHFIKGIL